MKTMNLKWVIAHEPAYLFYRVAEDFARIVNEKSKDVKINIEISTADEYNSRYNPAEAVTRHNLWKLLQDNTVQITQMQTTSLARQFNKQMHAFDLPYIFENHEHAAEVLEGEVGTYLLNKFDESSRLKGLAYTYSGGFRLLPLNHTVTSLGEIAGMPIRSGLAPQAIDTVAALGGKPVPADLEETLRLVRDGSVAGAEYVTQRIIPDGGQEWIKTIINTEHSLFLTSIVVNVDWWNGLDADIQSIFMEAALEAARNERALSIKDGEAAMAKLQSEGVTVINLSEEEKAELKRVGSEIQAKYADSYFETGLVGKIQKH